MTDEVYQKLNPVIDRLQEAHFWIHMLETHYHNADPFRWHLNVFLKAIKEILQIPMKPAGYSDLKAATVPM